MSRDIRSFFSTKSKSASVAAPATATTTPNGKRKPIVLDSDSEDESKKRPKASSSNGNRSSSKAATNKKRRVIVSSDEEDEKPKVDKDKSTLASKAAKLSISKEKKLKEVDVKDLFGDIPKRIEKERKPKKIKEKELLNDVDEDLFEIAEKLASPPKPEKPKESEKKTKTTPISKEAKQSPAKVKNEKVSPLKESKRNRNDTEKANKTPTSNKKPPAKKQKSAEEDLDISVYDPDQERHERKRAAAMLYKSFQNRAGPSKPGSKEIPKGKPNCLAGLTFVLSGVYESMERDEAAQVIKDFGGRVTGSISSKTTYLVAGEESGPAKTAKAEDMNIPIISEDDLLDLIREKSGMATKNKQKTETKEVEVKKEPDVKKEKKSPQKKKCSPQKKFKIEEPIAVKQEPVTPKSESSKKNDFALTWVDKHKPKTIKEIIGQQGANSNVEKLLKWLTNWHKNHNNKAKKAQRPNPWAKNDDGSFFKAALLSGPPGVGKTTTVQLVCINLGYDTIEFNASDTRSKKLLQVEVAELLSNKTLSGYVKGQNKSLTEKQVLVMDEVDGMAGNEDRGGMQELIALIKNTSVPIICMCNDRNHPKIRSLVNYCFDLRFARPRMEQIKGAMMSMCFRENIKIPPKTIEEVILATNNDVRQTINTLSLMSANTDFANTKMSNDNGRKDLRLGPWEVVRKVFSAEDHKTMSLNDKSDLFFHDYSMGPLFVQQNYLQVSPNVPKPKAIEQVALAADSLSLGDLVENRIRSQNAWSMLPVQAMYSSVLPGEYMEGHFTGQINFPAWLGKYSKANKRSRMAQEIHDHTRLRTSGSRSSIRLDYAPFLLQNIVQPMIDDGSDGVEEALSVMKEYRLLREDLDALVEITAWPGKKSLLDSVDGKVKAALTRAYNKEVAAFSYSAVSGVKKKRAAADDDFVTDESERIVSSDDENEDDDVEKDALIKAKKTTRASAAAAKKATATATTSKKAAAPRKKK